MAIRKRTSDVRLRKREKFGRKEAIAAYIINGDFETCDLTGWTTLGTVTILSSGCFEGVCCCELDSLALNIAHIRQNLPASIAGKTFHMDYYTAPNAGYYEVSIYDAVSNGFMVTLTQQAAWTSWEHAIPANCTTLPIRLEIMAHTWLGVSTKMYVDNIYIY